MKKLMIIGALLILFAGAESCRTTVVERPSEPTIARPPAPRADYVWIGGEWIIVGGKYQYRQGYWAPPRHGRVWIPGHWTKRGKGYFWIRGHWR